eukprot:scaffold2573_cov127-Skeletonema_dohrnii-CCMP3373.AAC.1
MLTGSTGVGVSSAAMIAARSRARIDVTRWYDAEWQLLFLLMVVCEDATNSFFIDCTNGKGGSGAWSLEVVTKYATVINGHILH